VVHVRPATLSDLDAIVLGNVALAEESEHLQLDSQTLREGVRALLTGRAPGRYSVAEIDARVVGQLLITYEWSDWRNRMVWWIQSVYVVPEARRLGIFRALYAYARQEALAAGTGGLRLYVDVTNTVAQAVYRSMGMTGDHYRVFEDMFSEPPRQT
jgi:GNAT superfamily N-acetyltransferase